MRHVFRKISDASGFQPLSQALAGSLAGGLAFGLFLGSAAWLVILAGQLGRPHPDIQWIHEAETYKQARAARLNVPKLIVAGGSSAMFGIDSQQLGQALQRPAINLGVNAGLGLPAILSQTLKSANPGDTVVLALEYPLFSYHGDVNHVMNSYYLSHPIRMLEAWRTSREALPLYRWLPLVAYEAWQILMQTSPERVLQGYQGLPEGFSVSGTYGTHRLDERGDQTDTLREQRQPWMAQQAIAEAPRRYGAEYRDSAVGWALLRYFQTQLKARNACLVIVPPAFLEHPLYRDAPAEKHFYTTLARQAAANGLNYVGNPYDFMYPADDMFDTDFHLVDEARRRHTQKLLGLLASNDRLEPLIDCANPPIKRRVSGQPLADEIAAAQPSDKTRYE